MKSERMTGYALLSFLIGILLARQKNPLLLIPLLALLGWLFFQEYQAFRRRRGIVKTAVLLLLFLLGAARFTQAAQYRERYESILSDGQEIAADGLIYQKETKNQNTIYYISHSHIHVNSRTIPTYQIRIYLDDDRAQVGDHILVHGKNKEIEGAANEGNFDAKAYYESRMLDLLIYGDDLKVIETNRLPLRRALSDFRERLRAVYAALLPEKEAGVLCTMLLGDKSLLDAEIKELYQTSGISHLLAISGLHISMIGMLLFRLLKLLRLPPAGASVLSGTLLVLYTVLTGASPSAVRACLMFLLTLLAPLVKRSYDSLTALSVAAFALLLSNPFLVGYSGFLFSFSAVFAVVVFGKALAGEHAGKVRQMLSVSLAVQLVTLPLVMQNYYEVPLYAMGLHLLVIPVAGVLLAFSLFGGFLGFIGLLVPARVVFFLPHLILTGYEKLCLFAAKLPFSELVTGRPDTKLVLFYYVLLGTAFILAKTLKIRQIRVIPMLLLLIFILVPKRQATELSVLDVGQGDGIFLSTPSGVAFIDGGSTDVKQVGKYRIGPFLKAKGVRAVDFWLVTHTDKDHISGLEELLTEGYPIKTLVFSRYVYQDEALEELCALARAQGTALAYLDKGQGVRLGAGSLECVFPDANYHGTDKNSLSLVLRYTVGDFSTLLTGDISSAEEAYLLQEGVSDIDLYKAAHHGSKYANSEAFLQALSPSVAAISCGARNRYGHPSEEAVTHILDSGAALYDTKDCGQIRVRITKEGMRIKTKKPLP